MKWWIVDDALKDDGGHYFEYVRTFKNGLEQLGDEVRVFSDRKAEPWLLEALAAIPCLPPSIWQRMGDGSPRWKRLLRYPTHGWQTFLAVNRLLKREPIPDIVFFPSVSTHHLLGLVPLLRWSASRIPARFLLFFPNTPIRHDYKSGRAVPGAEPMAAIFPILLRSLRSQVSGGNVILGAETPAMKEALEELSGVSIQYLPHPIPHLFPAQGQAPVTSSSSSPPVSRKILLGCYGPARHEKGSDLLQKAIREYLENNPDSRAHFAIQWLADFTDERGQRVEKDPALIRHPKVTYITKSFPPGDSYLRQVERTDIMILPYRDSYRYRLSRVVIESMRSGIPIIATRETTLSQQAEESGAVVKCDPESVESLCKAIRFAISNLDNLKSLAVARAPQARDHFSVRTFRERLRPRLHPTSS